MSKKREPISPAPIETPLEDFPLIIWKGPTGWIQAEPDGMTTAFKATLIVDDVPMPTVEVGRFALDDAHLSRLEALVSSGCAVELRDRSPFEEPELSPGEMQDLLARADEIRDTIGARAAEEFIAERTGGAI